ncbi:MAG: hypothetical protein KAU60_01760 [Desulfobacterales bacterium]|nr:hypothetical protein [Desulfobacterales bacterium]
MAEIRKNVKNIFSKVGFYSKNYSKPIIQWTSPTALTSRKRRSDFWKERLEEIIVKFDRVRMATTIYFAPN